MEISGVMDDMQHRKNMQLSISAHDNYEEACGTQR